jgi:hypothetical protein
MKKILLLFAFSIGALYGTNAQNQLKLGLNIGTAVNYYFGDANVALGADFSYLFPVSERLSFGPNAGFTLLLVNGSDNYGLLPITASGRYHFTDKFFAGADLGYSLIFIDEVNGGFYYRPKVGYELNTISLLASYIGITQNGGSFSIVSLGVEFSL